MDNIPNLKKSFEIFSNFKFPSLNQSLTQGPIRPSLFSPISITDENELIDFEEESETTESVNIKSNNGYGIAYKPDNLDISFDENGKMSVKNLGDNGKKLAIILDYFSGPFDGHGEHVMNYATDDIKNEVDVLAFDIAGGVLSEALDGLVENIKSGNLKADAVNISSSSFFPDEEIANKIKTLTEEFGIEVFMSAGNTGEGDINGYAQFKDGTVFKNEHFHLVGATDKDGKIAEYSSETEHVTDHAQGTFILQRTTDKDGNVFYTDGDIVFDGNDLFGSKLPSAKEKNSLILNEMRIKNMLSEFESANSSENADYITNYNKLKQDFETLCNSCTGFNKAYSEENSQGYIANSDTFLKIQAILDSSETPEDGEIDARFYLAKEKRGAEGVKAKYQNKEYGTFGSESMDLTGKKEEIGTSYASPNLMNMFLKGEMPKEDTSYTGEQNKLTKKFATSFVDFINKQRNNK